VVKFGVIITILWMLAFILNSEMGLVPFAFNRGMYQELFYHYEIIISFIILVLIPLLLIIIYLLFIYKNTGKYKFFDNIKINKEHMRYLKYLSAKSKEKGSPCPDNVLLSRIMNDYFQRRSKELNIAMKRDNFKHREERKTPFG